MLIKINETTLIIFFFFIGNNIFIDNKSTMSRKLTAQKQIQNNQKEKLTEVRKSNKEIQ